MGSFKDLTGKKFGKLTVLRKAGYKTFPHSSPQILWECECECGKHLTLRNCELKKKTSCGCDGQRHGQKFTRLYRIWCDMKSRCNNPNRKGYKNYGGRGIKLCQQWNDDFMTFYRWSYENGYQNNLTIDRIDVNGNYCPTNCRWTTAKVQANNTRSNHLIEYNGEIHDISEWAEILNIKPCTLFARINDYGWSVEKAFNQPVRKIKNK